MIPSRLAVLFALVLAAGVQAQTRPARPAAPAPAPAAPAAPAAAPAPAAPAPAAPSPHADQEQAGQLAAHGWLGLLDRRDWGTAWDASSTVFRQNVPLPAWMDGIPKVRAPLGTLVERKLADVGYRTTLPGRPDGEYVTVIFHSKFDKKEQVEEMVTTVRESDGRWRVTGYQTR
jgi:hypothetical protein